MLVILVATFVVAALCEGAATRKYEETFAKVHIIAKSKRTSWTSGVNSYFMGKNWNDIRKQLGTRFSLVSGPRVLSEAPVRDLPDVFDARKKWPQCGDRIGEIRDQGSCGSAWAVATANVASDRNCIVTNGKDNVALSAGDILACCGKFCGEGCDGGWPMRAMEYWKNNGLVTGGNYGNSNTCMSYQFPPNGSVSTPNCTQECEHDYSHSWSQDKRYAVSAYEVGREERAIRQEILDNGPVLASFTVYSDLMYYKSGIYQHISGEKLGVHSVKIIGWGSEAGIPYWLVVNEWGSGWGERGMFRIRRGTDECGIESEIIAGAAHPSQDDSYYLPSLSA